ncbi:hypothetical protein OAG76_03160 [Rubripirellula sp.]|nr:hypothetical protein [Rubripirellula sp.]MDB4634384.1 hypothetical protein [Rubripirellula sp.]
MEAPINTTIPAEVSSRLRGRFGAAGGCIVGVVCYFLRLEMLVLRSPFLQRHVRVGREAAAEVTVSSIALRIDSIEMIAKMAGSGEF